MFGNCFSKIVKSREELEKYCIAGQATEDNTAHAHCMLDTQGYKQTLRICNTYCFSTATMVAQTRPSVILYVHFLSSLKHITFHL